MDTTLEYVRNLIGIQNVQNATGFLGEESLGHQRAPIVEALLAYEDTIRFHMPGHRGGKGADPLGLSLIGQKAFANDVTGVPTMDDLQEPHGCIKEAQEMCIRDR